MNEPKGHRVHFFEVPLGEFFKDSIGRECFKNGEGTYKRNGTEFEMSGESIVYITHDEEEFLT